jgi:hypothetical protein
VETKGRLTGGMSSYISERVMLAPGAFWSRKVSVDLVYTPIEVYDQGVEQIVSEEQDDQQGKSDHESGVEGE